MNTTQNTLFARWKFLKDCDLPASEKREQLIYVQQQIIARMPKPEKWTSDPTILGVAK